VKPTLLLLILFTTVAASMQQRTTVDIANIAPAPSRHHPAIEYASAPLNDPVSLLLRKMQSGEVRLEFDNESGYLRSMLQALNVPVESQVAVFSKTSLQSDRINPANPRTIFFNDSVAVARPRNGFIELASTDPQQGVIFYSFGQNGRPGFRRDEECLGCHVSQATMGIPGLAVGSIFPAADGTSILDGPTFITDHRSALDQRWGGWYVTGALGTIRHMGNRVFPNERPPELASLKRTIDLTGYLSPYSDAVALLVLNHQAHMTNLFTRIGWENRVASYEGLRGGPPEARARRLTNTAKELVDYLLFIDEASLPHKVHGTSGFAEQFQSLGPKDSKGRSLRELDLETHLMRYRCSYMIYSAAFDGMPADAKEAVYSRMWQVLSGRESAPQYARRSLADRKAVVEILQATKKGLPDYFAQIAE
jgi:hypothetical protein